MPGHYQPHPCIVCGTITRNKYCCSHTCEEEEKRRKREALVEGVRECPCCHKMKPVADFYALKKDGYLRPCTTCSACRATGQYRRLRGIAKVQKKKKPTPHKISGYLPTWEGWGNIKLGAPDPFATPVAA